MFQQFLEARALFRGEFRPDVLASLMHQTAELRLGLLPKITRPLLSLPADPFHTCPLLGVQPKFALGADEEFHPLLFQHGAQFIRPSPHHVARGRLPVGWARVR